MTVVDPLRQYCAGYCPIVWGIFNIYSIYSAPIIRWLIVDTMNIHRLSVITMKSQVTPSAFWIRGWEVNFRRLSQIWHEGRVMSNYIDNEDSCLLSCCCLVLVYRRFRGACCLQNKAIIALMMEATNTSETVNFYQTTRRSNPKDSHLCTVSVWGHQLTTRSSTFCRTCGR
jgi:hypothetical protein